MRFSLMFNLMKAQRLITGKSFAAYVALIWSFPCMDANMNFQVTSAHKAFWTFGAGKWSFPRVDACMNFQVFAA